jgi:hypothetical protein
VPRGKRLGVALLTHPARTWPHTGHSKKPVQQRDGLFDHPPVDAHSGAVTGVAAGDAGGDTRGVDSGRWESWLWPWSA